MKIDKPSLIRFSKYSFVGVGTFLLDISLLFILTKLTPLSPVFLSPLCFLLAISINYLLSRRLVFKETSTDFNVGYGLYILVAAFGALAIFVGMHILVTTLKCNYIYSRVGIACVIGMINYLFNLYYTFKVAGKNNLAQQ